MTQALFHRRQDIGVASRLDKHDAVGMKTGEAERGREKIAPTQAPHHRAIHAREHTRKEDRGRSIVGEGAAAGYFVECAGRDPPARQMSIYSLDAEGQNGVFSPHALDLRDLRSQ